MIVPGIVDSFIFDMAQGVHQPNDAYMMALYVSAADLSPTTELYTPKGEVTGAKGYTPGGTRLTGRVAKRLGPITVITFADPTWPHSSIAARGALIYNKSRNNRALVVLDFGQDVRGTNGTFFVVMPAVDSPDAIIQLGVEAVLK